MNTLKWAISGIFGTLTASSFIEREMNNPDIETVEPIDNVTIIVPSFNEETFIKKCLSSIMGQSIIQEYPQCFELILVDSSSKYFCSWTTQYLLDNGAITLDWPQSSDAYLDTQIKYGVSTLLTLTRSYLKVF